MIELGEYAAQKARRLAEDHINEARKYAKADAENCKNYLKAAQIAVIGLEKECDQILVQAENCDLNQRTQIDHLRFRIDNYLGVDSLRHELNIAIGGLKDCREGLQRDADGYLQWPWVKRDRREAVAKFVGLLEDLEKYYKRLSAQIEYRRTGTGIYARELLHIREVLSTEQNKAILKREIDLFVSEVRRNSPDRTNLMDLTRKIENVTNKLIREFR